MKQNSNKIGLIRRRAKSATAQLKGRRVEQLHNHQEQVLRPAQRKSELL